MTTQPPIQVGQPLPAVTLKVLGENGMTEIDTGSYFRGKTVVLFSVPGAFTPTCSAKHLPGFVEQAAALKAKGVDEIACTAVNDPFVMKAWAAQGGAAGKVTMLPDGNAQFATALGLTMDGSGYGLGTRGQRFAMIVRDGVVTDVQVEPPGAFGVSSAEQVLARLDAQG